jgi:hypothetical protein
VGVGVGVLGIGADGDGVEGAGRGVCTVDVGIGVGKYGGSSAGDISCLGSMGAGRDGGILGVEGAGGAGDQDGSPSGAGGVGVGRCAGLAGRLLAENSLDLVDIAIFLLNNLSGCCLWGQPPRGFCPTGSV